MKLTLKIKMRPLTKRKEKILLESIEEFKSCVNDWLKAIEELGKYPTREKLHSFAYKKIKEKYNLHSSIIQDAMNLAIEIYRSWLKTKGNKPTFNSDCIYLRKDVVKIENDGLVVPLRPRNKVYFPLYIRRYHRKYLNYKIGRAIIVKEGNDFYACITVEFKEPEPYKPQGYIGIDFGYYNIVVVADEKGRELLRVQGDELIKRKEYYERLRARRQQRLMKVFRINDKELGHKDGNYVNDLNHKIAKQIVMLAKNMRKAIVIEKLRGLKQQEMRKRKKKLRKILARWSYADLIEKIKYKAKLEGVPVIEVSPKYTSKTCSRCGYYYKYFKSQRIFKCPKCGLVIDRDLNASINIARKGFEGVYSGGLSSPL